MFNWFEYYCLKHILLHNIHGEGIIRHNSVLTAFRIIVTIVATRYKEKEA